MMTSQFTEDVISYKHNYKLTRSFVLSLCSSSVQIISSCYLIITQLVKLHKLLIITKGCNQYNACCHGNTVVVVLVVVDQHINAMWFSCSYI